MRLTRHASKRLGTALSDPDERPTWLSPGAKRRLDPLSLLACQVVDRLFPEGITDLDPDTGLAFHSHCGSVESTLRFLDSMHQYGDAGASPTPFSTAVHNATAGAIGQVLGIHGPSTTLSDGCFAASNLFAWARLMLHSGRCARVLVLCGEVADAWSQARIAAATASAQPFCNGMWGVLLEAGDGHGHAIGKAGVEMDTLHCVLDMGGSNAREAAALQAAAGEHERIDAAAAWGGWFPGSALCVLPFGTARPCVLRECEDRHCRSLPIGAWSE